MPEEMSNGASSGNHGNSKRKRGSDWIRKRVSQACDQCRKKKLKCDGLRPTCSTCASLNSNCFYDDAVKKRGLPEGYVRGLESLLGLLQSNATSIESASTLFEDALENEASKRKLIQRWHGDGTATGETMAEKWRSSRLCKDLENLLPSLDASEIKGQESKRPRVESHSVDYTRSTSPAQTGPHLPTRDDAEDIFATYFTFTNSWLPIIRKDDMLASYYRALELSESSLGSGERAALWAVLAYSLCQKTSNTRMGFLRQSSKACSYYDKARYLISNETSALHTSHVQALLVLALVKMGMGQLRASWLLVNEAINDAIDLGMQGDSSSTPILNHTKDESKRVFFGCFYLDTLLAACLGRSPRFRKNDAVSAGFLDENGLEEWGHLEMRHCRPGEKPASSRSISIFNHVIRLICVLNDFAHSRVPSEFQKIQIAFTEWRTSFPAHCPVDASGDKAPTQVSLPPHHLNLHFTFLVCTLVFHRIREISTKSILREAKVLSDIMETSWNPASGSIISPPTFCLILNLALDSACPEEQQWAVDCTVSPLSSTIEVALAANSRTCTSTPKLSMTADPSAGAVRENSSIAPDGMYASYASRANLFQFPQLSLEQASKHSTTTTTMSGNISLRDSEQISKYITSEDLLQIPLRGQTSQAKMDNGEGTEKITPDNCSQIPQVLPTESEPPTSDTNLQSVLGADDYFFELLNLDQLTGNQDETYRNLGFLSPDSHDSPSTSWQATVNDQAGSMQTPDEWSQWFGTATAFGDAQYDI